MGWGDRIVGRQPAPRTAEGDKRSEKIGAALGPAGFLGYDPIQATDASRATFHDLELRWGKIERCLLLGPWANGPVPGDTSECPYPQVQHDVPKARHNTKNWYAAWLPFRDEWRAGKTRVTMLSSQVSGLNAAEEELRRFGAEIKDRPTPAPDIEESSTPLQAAAAASRAADTAAEAVKSAASMSAGGLWDAIPLPVKIVGGVGILAFGAAQLARLIGR